MTSRNRDWMTFSAHQKPTVGDSKFSAVQYDHMGWLKCDGRILNVTDFQFLFNSIGYSFGGSGAQFNLPNPWGRVPGVSGQGTDSNNSTFTIKLGDSIGEYVHRLSIPEMPSHNHGTDTYPDPSQSSYNNSTSLEYTGISVLNSTTMITADQPAHSHTGTTDAAGWAANAVSIFPGTDAGADNAGSHTHTFTTDLTDPPITITDPSHKHDINDPGHRHTLNAAGGDFAHNNVQPTLGMGNMFIYSGLISWGNYPYTTGPSPTTYPYKSPSQAPSGTPNNIW
jgi:microcystin-dependent protein